MTSDRPLSSVSGPDVGILLLRLGVGGLMIFHGVHKLMHGHGFIRQTLAEHALPELLWLGVPVGEVLAPVLILLGVAVRLSAAVVAFTMAFSIYLAFGLDGFRLNQFGGLAVELNLLFMFSSLALVFLGTGRCSVYRGRRAWLR